MGQGDELGLRMSNIKYFLVQYDGEIYLENFILFQTEEHVFFSRIELLSSDISMVC